MNKIDRLHLEIENWSHDIVVLTETHLDDSILDSEIFPSKFIVFRKERKCFGRHGGGVPIAVRNSIKIMQRDDLTCYQSELLFVDIDLKRGKTFTIGVFYGPPNKDLEALKDLQNALSEISTNDILMRF